MIRQVQTTFSASLPMTRIRSLRSIALLLLSLLASHSLHAQSTRTWVASTGNDSNPCSRTAPCATFAGAIVKTAAYGQINVLDAGGFGGVTITTPITIDASGSFAGVLTPGTTAITIHTGPYDIVVLRGLTLDGASTGLNGIHFLAGGILHIENCVINNFNEQGIVMEPTTGTFLFIKDTIVRNNKFGGAANGSGILLKPGGAGSVRAQLDNVRSEDNIYGLRVENNTETTVANSVFSGNLSAGINAVSTAGGNVQVNCDNCTVSNNALHGVTANGLNAIVRLSETMVTNNSSTGINPINSGQVLTFGTNRIAGNHPNGAFTASGLAEQ